MVRNKKKSNFLKLLKPALSFWLVVLLILQIAAGVLFLPPIKEAKATIYTNATNNADTYLRASNPNTNYGTSTVMGVYGSGSKMVALMNWTLPEGSGDITYITLNLFCRKWDNWPSTPVELHVLNEGFNESEATWNNRTSGVAWTNPGAWTPTSTNSTIVDEVLVNKEGYYTWILKGSEANNSLDSLTWGDTINIALMLPNEVGYHGIKIMTKEISGTPNVNYKYPALIITTNNPSIPEITGVSPIKIVKKNALIKIELDTPAFTKILYGTSPDNLDESTIFSSYATTSYHLLAHIYDDNEIYTNSANTTYYYKVYASKIGYGHGVDSNYETNSSVYNFTTEEDIFHVPLVSFTFDDACLNHYTNALPILNNSLFPGVEYPPINWIGGGSQMNWTQIWELQNTYGWEIGSHSMSHPELTTLTDSQLEYELNESKNELQSHGINVYSIASPYGDFDSHVRAYIMRFYNAHRAAGGGLETPPYDEFRLKVKSVGASQSVDDVKGWVDDATNNNQWLILMFHNIVDGVPTGSEWNTINLQELANYVESKGELRVVTIEDGMTTSFDYKGIYANTVDKIITNTIDANGDVTYSKCVTGHQRANITITPSSGLINTTITTWLTSGTYYKKWTETADGTLSVIHTIGDLKANTYYTIKVDATRYNTYLSNSSGEISFTYTGTYSAHDFEVEEDTTSPVVSLVSPSNNSSTDNSKPTLFWSASDSESGIAKFQLYIDGTLNRDNIQKTATSIQPLSSLQLGPHTWYVVAIDNSGKEKQSEIFTINISGTNIYKNLKNTVFSDGKVIYSKIVNQDDIINLSITPSFGSLNLEILTWNISGDYQKKWKEEASSPDIVADHTVGNLKPNTPYQVLVSGELFGTYTANTEGEISFTYNKGYSEKTFEVKEKPTTGNEQLITEGEEELAGTGNKASFFYYLLPFFFLAVGIFLWFWYKHSSFWQNSSAA